jgi:branched-chain amino acid transport system substrate-binding protein
MGIPVSLSGQFQVQGRQALAGIRAWVAAVNRAGGLLVADLQWRFPVALIHYDDASSPETARQVTERLILEDRVDLLFGPYSSVLSRAAAGVAEEYQQVLWNQGGSSDNIHRRGFRWVVSVLSPASEYLTGLPHLVRRADPQANRLAVIRAATGAFPRAVASGVERQAAELGFQKVAHEEFDPATEDFSNILDRVEGQRPDLLLAVGRIENDLALARQLVERWGFPNGSKRGSKPGSQPDAPGAVALVATPIQQFQEALGPGVEGFIGPSQWESGGGSPQHYGPTAERILESLRQEGQFTPDSSDSADYPLMQAYAAGLVAQRCVEEAGTLEPEALRETAGEQDFATFYGRFKIDPDSGRQIGHSVVIVQWQQGRKVIVWPPEQRQGELVYPWR